MKTLDGAATLGYGYQITGKREYGNLAKKILLECARWDPEGSTSRRYNDEAGMPYLSRFFPRTYSYVQELLTEPERELCRRVIRIRGNEAFHSLYPRLFFRPYDSMPTGCGTFSEKRGWSFSVKFRRRATGSTAPCTTTSASTGVGR